MNDTFAELYDRALQLRDDGRYVEAVAVLERLLTDRIDKRARLAAAHYELGNIHTYQLARPDLGETHFRMAVKLTPFADLASLGLFHSLIAQRKDLEALEEMKRFTSQHPSQEYEQVGWDLLGGSGAPT